MSVRDYMTAEIVAVAPSSTAADVMDTFTAHNIRHLPVVDGTTLVGIVSGRDLHKAATGRPDETIVGDLMTADPVTVGPGEALVTAARILVRHGFGCLPVVDGGRLVGLLSESDLLRGLLATMEADDSDTHAPRPAQRS